MDSVQLEWIENVLSPKQLKLLRLKKIERVGIEVDIIRAWQRDGQKSLK